MNWPQGTLSICIFTLALGFGCGSSDTDDPGGGTPDAAASNPTPDAAPGTPMADASVARPDADPSAPTATLTGTVSRSTEPQAGGVGPIYIAIFENDPVAGGGGGDTSGPVATALLDNADLSADGASLPYSVTGIPPRAEPYFIVAFLDDNKNADTSNPESAGPDKGDLVSMKGLGSPSVVIDSASETNFDIVLNLAMPW